MKCITYYNLLFFHTSLWNVIGLIDYNSIFDYIIVDTPGKLYILGIYVNQKKMFLHDCLYLVLCEEE